jgi:hypothetical protein
MKGLTSMLLMTCYHGSTAEKLSPGSDYRKNICHYVSLLERLWNDDSATGELTDMSDNLNMEHMQIPDLANSYLH